MLLFKNKTPSIFIYWYEERNVSILIPVGQIKHQNTKQIRLSGVYILFYFFLKRKEKIYELNPDRGASMIAIISTRIMKKRKVGWNINCYWNFIRVPYFSQNSFEAFITNLWNFNIWRENIVGVSIECHWNFIHVSYLPQFIKKNECV